MPAGNNGAYKADFNNFLYPHFRNGLLTGVVGDIRITPSPTSALKVSFLNAGVGTNYTFSSTGATGYAWNPAINDSTYAGYAITYFSAIPTVHRTMSASTGAPTSWGGNAITTVLTGVGVSYSGVLFADNVTTYQVTAGAAVSSFVLYKWVRNNTGGGSGDTALEDAASLLIAYFDCATGMPVAGNGGDITVVWDTGVNKIFKI